MPIHLQIVVPLRKELILALTIFLIPDHLTLQRWMGHRFWQVPLEEAARRKSEPVHRCSWSCFKNGVRHDGPEHHELPCRNDDLLLPKKIGECSSFQKIQFHFIVPVRAASCPDVCSPAGEPNGLGEASMLNSLMHSNHFLKMWDIFPSNTEDSPVFLLYLQHEPESRTAKETQGDLKVPKAGKESHSLLE